MADKLSISPDLSFFTPNLFVDSHVELCSLTKEKGSFNSLKREKNNAEFKTIKNYIKKLNLTGFIVGLPLNDEGKMTSQALDCETYGEFLFHELKLPFSFVNEHSSTWESTNRFGVKKDKSGLIDSLSAKVILEQWIKEGPELKKLIGN